MTAYSVNPAGEKFPIPSEADYAEGICRGFRRWSTRPAAKARKSSW